MDLEDNRIITSTKTVQEQNENILRPKTFTEYIGQDRIKSNLQVFIKAAKKRKEALDHVLFYGPPGLGKTTLSHIIANEMSSQIRITSGPAIEKAGDLAAIITNLDENDILFIDEIHRLNKNIIEVLYPAMEDYALDIIIGKGPSARSIRLDLPRFTLIGATTSPGRLAAPLRDRFGVSCRLELYNTNDLIKIVKRTANILEIKIDDKGAKEIASRSRGTPRVANRLLKRVRDFAQVQNKNTITLDIAKSSLKLMEIDSKGLDLIDRKLLTLIIEKFGGGPVGVETLSAAIGEDVSTIEDIYEPYLMQLSFIARTPRGRVCLEDAYKHLGYKYTHNEQRDKTLFDFNYEEK